MKIVAIGDVHGRKNWKAVAERESDADKIVFIGDYFDNFLPMTVERILKNFQNIVSFKEQNPEQVVLLIGNHDFHYMAQCGDDRYSGYDGIGQTRYEPILVEKADLFQAAYQYDDILFTHAGVTKSWATKNKVKGTVLDGQINGLFAQNPEAFRFNHSDVSGCGADKRQGPLWVRPEQLLRNKYPGLKQVVGHTGMPKVTIEDCVAFIDTASRGSYLVIEDGIFRVVEPYLV